MSNDTVSSVYVGIGGWNFEPWRGTFYPDGLTQKRELEYAARHVTSIEINGTYYGPQKPETFAKWHDEAPESFLFSVKAPRIATNRKVLAEAGSSIERFLTGGVLELKDKLGPINWQFMPTKKFDPVDFEAFLKLLPKRLNGRDIRHVVEVRHESFSNAEFVAMVREYGVAVVITDKLDFPQIADLTAPFVYLRLMASRESEPSGYSSGEINLWVKRAQEWCAGGDVADLRHASDKPPVKLAVRDVFVYFISGFKVRNPAAAMEFIKRHS
ncbi:MAG: DUF72 domain-containing protein [Phyllobacterium sp.]